MLDKGERRQCCGPLCSGEQAGHLNHKDLQRWRRSHQQRENILSSGARDDYSCDLFSGVGDDQVCADNTWGAPLTVSQNRLISDSGDWVQEICLHLWRWGTLNLLRPPVKQSIGERLVLSHTTDWDVRLPRHWHSRSEAFEFQVELTLSGPSSQVFWPRTCFPNSLVCKLELCTRLFLWGMLDLA